MTPLSQQRLALATYVRLMRAANTARTHASRHLGGTGLTLTQFAVLEALYHLGPMSLSDIAQKILTTGGNLTMVLGNLEKLGLAHRQKCPEDRRVLIVVLTAKGKAMIGKLFPDSRRRHRRVHGRAVSRRTAATRRPLPQARHPGSAVILNGGSLAAGVEGPCRRPSHNLASSFNVKASYSM